MGRSINFSSEGTGCSTSHFYPSPAAVNRPGRQGYEQQGNRQRAKTFCVYCPKSLTPNLESGRCGNAKGGCRPSSNECPLDAKSKRTMVLFLVFRLLFFHEIRC